jgi:hypothetical protein
LLWCGVMLYNTLFIASNTHSRSPSNSYVQSNPFKIIAGVGIPTVASIFYGQTEKAHVNMQMKILHTRVFGQFAVVCTLLGVMGLKEMMDRR